MVFITHFVGFHLVSNEHSMFVQVKLYKSMII